MIDSIERTAPDTVRLGSARTGGVRNANAVVARSDFFEQPVPRRFVHRASVAEVLITGFAADALPDTFLLAAQWPRGHSLYRTVRGLHDPLLFAESVRQAGLMISHVGYRAPLNHSAIMRNMTYDLSTASLVCDGAPTNLILFATCKDVRFRKETLLGFQIITALRRGMSMESIGIGVGELQCVSPSVYRRLRGDIATPPQDRPPELPEPVAPVLVGKDIRADVVLARTEAENTWLLRCDTTHPVLFDHPVDHVPGMVLIEAMRQSAHCALYPRRSVMTRFASKFERYTELNVPTVVRAFPEGAGADGSVRVRIELTQDGNPVAVGWCHCHDLL